MARQCGRGHVALHRHAHADAARLDFGEGFCCCDVVGEIEAHAAVFRGLVDAQKTCVA